MKISADCVIGAYWLDLELFCHALDLFCQPTIRGPISMWIIRSFDSPLSWRYDVKDISQNGDTQRMDELKPLPPEEFKKVLADKGWSPEMLAARWGMTKRRIQQIAADADRPRYYDDAIGNLPIIVKG